MHGAEATPPVGRERGGRVEARLRRLGAGDGGAVVRGHRLLARLEAVPGRVLEERQVVAQAGNAARAVGGQVRPDGETRGAQGEPTLQSASKAPHPKGADHPVSEETTPLPSLHPEERSPRLQDVAQETISQIPARPATSLTSERQAGPQTVEVTMRPPNILFFARRNVQTRRNSDTIATVQRIVHECLPRSGTYTSSRHHVPFDAK